MPAAAAESRRAGSGRGRPGPGPSEAHRGRCLSAGLASQADSVCICISIHSDGLDSESTCMFHTGTIYYDKFVGPVTGSAASAPGRGPAASVTGARARGH
eukprot:382630-Hanusia_phi.AAC.1